MRNGAHATVCGIGKVNQDLTLGKVVQLKNMQCVPSIINNLISGPFLCRDDYKLVFYSNKCIISKYRTIIDKGYKSGNLFHLSLSDACFKSINHVSYNRE